MIEGRNFLDGYFLARGFVQCRTAMSISQSSSAFICSRDGHTPHHSVRAFPDNILNVVLIRYVKGYLSRPIWWRSLLTSHSGIYRSNGLIGGTDPGSPRSDLAKRCYSRATDMALGALYGIIGFRKYPEESLVAHVSASSLCLRHEENNLL